MAEKRETRRRGNGEGSIFQRPDGTWMAQVTVGYDGNGKRLRRTLTGATKKEVQEKLTRLQQAKLDGMLSEPHKLTVAAFMERWLEDAARPRIRETSYISYEGVIRLHINTRIGGVKLTKLTPVQVQSLYGSMERDELSPRLRQLTHAVLRQALKQAVKWNLVPRNVCDAVDPPRVKKKEIAPLNADQVLAFFDAAEADRLYALYVLAALTGLRQGELFALKWSEVDFDNAIVTVKATLVEVKGKFKLSEPKSAKSRRRVGLPKLAIEALHEQRKRLMAEGLAASEWVFCDTEGGHLRRSNMIRNSFKPILTKAELPDIRFHDLRHTAATLLASENVHPKVVQEMLGHSQITLTLDTYSHAWPHIQTEAAAKIGDAIKKAADRKAESA